MTLMSLCGHNPPLPWCWQCKRAGLVPWQPGDQVSADRVAPPGSPTARGEFPPLVVPPPPAPAPPCCVHLGTERVGKRTCATCRGHVEFFEFACALGLGVEGRAVPSADCGPGRCPGYSPSG